MTTLDERYRDLCDGASDPALARLVRDLDRAYATQAPPRVRAAFQQLLHEQPANNQPAARRWGWPLDLTRRHRHGVLVAAVVTAAALLTGSVLAASPLVNDVALWFNNGDVPAASGPAHNAPDQTPPLGTLGTAINQSQTVCGYTVTLTRLYADVNRVTVGYTLTWPASRHYHGGTDFHPTLADAHGAPLPMFSGVSDLPRGNETWNATTFDASSVATTTAPLALHLTIPTIGLESATTIPDPAACERVEGPQPDPYSTGRTAYPVAVRGPFTFDVTTPVTTSLRTADINQSLTSSHGTTVTLERVVVTPTEARLYYRGPSEMFLAGGTPTLPVLYVDGKEIDGTDGTPLGGGRWSYSFGNWGVNLYQNHSEWSFKILTDPTMTNYRRAWTDAVTFHVKVP